MKTCRGLETVVWCGQVIIITCHTVYPVNSIDLNDFLWKKLAK